MIKLESLKGKTKDEIIDICRKDGYKYQVREPVFFDTEKLFSSENKTQGFTVGYAWDIIS